MRALLDRGAELGQRSRRGATALHFAAQSAGNLEVLQMLLAHPACSLELVKLKGHRQRSALLLAVMSRDEPAAVAALLEAGADPSERCASMGNISLLHSCAQLARWVGRRVGGGCRTVDRSPAALRCCASPLQHPAPLPLLLCAAAPFAASPTDPHTHAAPCPQGGCHAGAD